MNLRTGVETLSAALSVMTPNNTFWGFLNIYFLCKYSTVLNYVLIVLDMCSKKYFLHGCFIAFSSRVDKEYASTF